MDITPEDVMMMGRPYAELDPTTMGALVCWVEGRKLVGLSDGDPVSSFTDQSGAGNHLTSTTTGRPAYKINQINGFPGVQYTTVNQQWSGKTFVANQPVSRVMVFRVDTRVDLKEYWDGIPDPNTAALINIDATTLRLRSGVAGTDLTVPIITNGSWHICSAVYNGASSIFRWDGAQQAFTVSVFATGGITLANNAYHTTGGSDITIAAFLQYSGDISANFPTIEAWLKTVYSLP